MKNNYSKYLIALDLDGTLLNNKKNICFLTKKYLKKLNKKGVNIVLCSGRAPRTMINYYNKLKLNSPMICYNGALTYNPFNDNFKKISYQFDHEKLIKIYSLFSEYVEITMCESKNNIYIDKEDDFLFTFFQKGNMNIFNNIKDSLNEDTYTYVIKLKKDKDNKENRLKLQELVKESTFNYRLRYWHDSPYGEFHFENVNKAFALKQLAKTLNIDENNIYVFGDAGNDIEMLNTFSNSYLMRNGNKEIRKYASNITKKDNNHNGIYYELKEIFKNI